MKYVPGIKDDDFIRGKVPMTKREIRLYLLAKANLSADATVIDVGAGTGSISIEAAFSAPKGQVYAVEKELAGIELIKANMHKFQVKNIKPVLGEAPEALYNLPPATTIFVGGSGGRLEAILHAAYQKLVCQGILICSAVTVETLQRTLQWADKQELEPDACSLQVTRLKKVAHYHMFDALNPIYIVSFTKKS